MARSENLCPAFSLLCLSESKNKEGWTSKIHLLIPVLETFVLHLHASFQSICVLDKAENVEKFIAI